MNVIVYAAQAAREATESALAEASRQVPAPTRAEVERVIESLPSAAAKGREDRPMAAWFDVLRWSTRDRAVDALASLVVVDLRQMGLDADICVDGSYESLRVNYESLFKAADAERRVEWRREAAELWRQRAGDDAAVIMDRGALSFAVLGDVTRGGPQTWAAPYDAIDRSPAAVVADAAAALGLPAWGPLSSLLSAWRARAGHGSAVEAQGGRWVSGVYRQVPCLSFVAASGSWAIDEADVQAWTQADLIAMAADECGLTPPAAATAPVTQPRQDKRRGSPARAGAAT